MPNIDPKNIILHRSRAIGAPGALFRHSKILTQNLQIFRHSLFRQILIQKPFFYNRSHAIGTPGALLRYLKILPPPPKIFEILDIILSPNIDPKKHFSTSISCHRGPWGPFLDIQKFWPKIYKFLDIRYFAKYWSKNHFSTSISCPRGPWGPF